MFGKSIMIFFGHRLIESENLYHVQSIDAISNTPASSIVFLNYHEDKLDVVKHGVVNGVRMALHVESISELMYGSALGCTYLTVNKSLAKTAQDLAQNYLFDAKILVHVESEDDIEELALLGVDGVVFSNAIIKINS